MLQTNKYLRNGLCRWGCPEKLGFDWDLDLLFGRIGLGAYCFLPCAQADSGIEVGLLSKRAGIPW